MTRIEEILSRWDTCPERVQTCRALREVLSGLADAQLKALETRQVLLTASAGAARAIPFYAAAGVQTVFVSLDIDLERLPYARALADVRNVIVYAVCRIEGMDERGACAAAAEITRSADLDRQVQEGGYPVM